jgi:hypothetical protein
MWHVHLVWIRNCDILQRNPGYQAIIAVKKHLQAEVFQRGLNLTFMFGSCPVTSVNVAR